MPHEPDFYPPRLNPSLVRLIQTIAPPLVRWFYWAELEIDEADLQQLMAFRNQRLLLLPNHPTFHDPIMMFILSARLKQSFYYLAAYETFGNLDTMFLISARFILFRYLAKLKCLEDSFRRLLQQLGMYSIRRGLPDRSSIAKTLELLAQPACHLVIFPEGGCSFQNDTVMPFRPGAIQLAFRALDRLAKQAEQPPDLYVIPIAIKYHYTQDPEPIIQSSLKRLEKRLDLTPPETATAYERLRKIAETVLIQIEQEYGLDSSVLHHQDWNDRIQRLKQSVVQEVAQRLSIPYTPGDLIRERVYQIQHLLQTQTEEVEQDPVLTLDWVEKATSRLLNFDAIYDGYVAENPTPERFLDTLTRLEREVFDIDQPPPKGYRQAKLQLGQPMNLKTYFEDYRRDRTEAVNQLTTVVQQSVQAKLDSLRTH